MQKGGDTGTMQAYRFEARKTNPHGTSSEYNVVVIIDEGLESQNTIDLGVFQWSDEEHCWRFTMDYPWMYSNTELTILVGMLDDLPKGGDISITRSM